nr:hypothetical protein GCM10020093_061780 [Planobispora longispora]
MYAHWFRTSVLRRLGGARFVASSAERSVTFTTLRELTVQRFPERLDHYLPVSLRARATLLRAGRLDQLVALAQATQGTHLRAEVRDVSWRDGALVMSLTGEIMWGDGRPVRFLPTARTACCGRRRSRSTGSASRPTWPTSPPRSPTAGSRSTSATTPPGPSTCSR